MPLSEPQQQTLKNWMQSKAILQCPACGDTQWQYAKSAYIRTLLERDEPDLTEESGVVKISCGNCGYLMLFNAEILGIRGLWAEGRGI